MNKINITFVFISILSILTLFGCNKGTKELVRIDVLPVVVESGFKE